MRNALGYVTVAHLKTCKNTNFRMRFAGGTMRVALGAIFLAGFACGHLQAAFSGPFSFENWTLINSNTDGSVLSNSPLSVTLVGGDLGPVGGGELQWRIAVPSAGIVSFDWHYSTHDNPAGPWDSAGWRTNQQSTFLAGNNSPIKDGSVSFSVGAGTALTFWVRTEDNLGGRAELQVSNFVFSAQGPPRIYGTSVNNEIVTFNIATIPGHLYKVEACTNLTAAVWSQIGSDIVAVGTNAPFSANRHGFPMTYFRVFAP